MKSGPLILALATLIAGCGYNHGPASTTSVTTAPTTQTSSGYHWSTLYRGDVRTVAVPIFSSKDFNRGIEFEVSKAVVNQLEAHSPYKVVPRERADTIIEGEVVALRVSTLSNDFNAA